MKPKLNKSLNTFHNDPKINRSEQLRRDQDTVKTPTVNLYDIDYSIKSFIDTVIQPVINENGVSVQVPVMYANPEKWKSIQHDGFLRDDKGKMMYPLIVYRRTSFTQRDALRYNKVSEDYSNQIAMKKQYTKANRYDKFSVLKNQKPVNEYYYITVPEYITVEYELMVWCEYVKDLNYIVELIKYWEGKAWGERHKFITIGTSYDFESVNATGQDKINKARIGLKTNAYLIPDSIGKSSNMKKSISVGKLIFSENTVDDINKIPSNETTGSSL